MADLHKDKARMLQDIFFPPPIKYDRDEGTLGMT